MGLQIKRSFNRRHQQHVCLVSKLCCFMKTQVVTREIMLYHVWERIFFLPVLRKEKETNRGGRMDFLAMLVVIVQLLCGFPLTLCLVISLPIVCCRSHCQSQPGNNSFHNIGFGPPDRSSLLEIFRISAMHRLVFQASSLNSSQLVMEWEFVPI